MENLQIEGQSFPSAIRTKYRHKYVVDSEIQEETNSRFRSLATAIKNAKEDVFIFVESGSHELTGKFHIAKDISIVAKSNTVTISLEDELILDKNIAFKRVKIVCSGIGITVRGGRAIFENCLIFFEGCARLKSLPDAKLTLQQNLFFQRKIKNVRNSDNQRRATIHICGNADLIGNTITGNSIPLNGVLVDGGNPTIKLNNLCESRTGICVRSGSPLIFSNQIFKCNEGISSQTTSQLVIHNNEISNTLSGIVVDQPCKIEITDNKISNIIGPAIVICQTKPVPVIKSNTLSDGRTFAVFCGCSEKIQSIEKQNSFSEFPLGTVTSERDLQFVAEAIVQLCRQPIWSLHSISVATKSNPEEVRSVLTKFSKIFRMELDYVTLYRGIAEGKVAALASIGTGQ